MGRISISRRIDAPQERVFELFTNFEDAAKNIRGIQSLDLLTDGEVGVGTKFRETRVFMKREATEELEITEYSPHSSYAVECESCGCHYRSVFSFASAAEGTDVTMTMDTKPLTAMAKVMSPLMGMLMSGTMRKCMNADFDDLQRLAEEG